jgi:hypothetical protein
MSLVVPRRNKVLNDSIVDQKNVLALISIKHEKDQQESIRPLSQIQGANEQINH